MIQLVLRAMRGRGHAPRSTHARIAKQGGAVARPWLEKGRERKLGPERTNRKLSKQVYEAKLDALLGVC
ncbi:MAG TPA: hypothetical protein VGC41_21310 [Kofleriaceae bacterium]